MKCLLCGMELNQATTCQVCGERVVSVVGNMTEDLQKKLFDAARDKRARMLSSTTVSLRSYYWKDVDGELVQSSTKDIKIGQNLGSLDIGQVAWGNEEYARQTVGEQLELTVVVKDGTGKEIKQQTRVIAPETSGLWKVGCVLKPGLRVAIRVGNTSSYSDSGEISLRG